MVEIEVITQSRQEFRDITAQVQAVVARSGVSDGLCHLFCPHTTAGLTANENWDPTVRRDLGAVLDRLVPERGDYQHSEGNAPAHVKAALVGSSVTLFVKGGRLLLGTWQGVYLAEFDGPRQRRVLVEVVASQRQAA
jgi:secondary thiamine-phosphate synthase enzyme